MLALDIDEFAIELKDGSVKNVGATNKRATAKLFDVAEATAREYGGDRVKVVASDDAGNEVQLALSAGAAAALADDLAALDGEPD